MITKERAEKAKKKLIGEAEAVEDFCKRVESIAESGFLDKWNGKLVNRRIYAPLARAYGLEEKTLSDGETFFEDGSFKFDYMPPPLYGSNVPQLKVEVCKGWGAFGIPLCVDENCKLDATKTREAWMQINELHMKHAQENRDAAELVDQSAELYNKVEGMVVPFLEKTLRGVGPN